MTNMSNATPERFYNSFEGTVWLNVAQAVLGPLFIAIIIPIFICCLIIKKNRQGIRHYGFWNNLYLNFISNLWFQKKNCDNFKFHFYSSNRLNNINILWVDRLVWISIYLGWMQNVREDFQSYQGPKSNNVTFDIDAHTRFGSQWQRNYLKARTRVGNADRV